MRDWGPVVNALLDGRVILIEKEWSPRVTGRLSSQMSISGKYVVRVRQRDDGVVTWLEQKEQR